MILASPGARAEGPALPLRSSIAGEGFGLMAGGRPLRLQARRTQPSSSIRGWFSSPKALGPAVYESLLERDAQTLISVDPTVAKYAVQCHRLTYWTIEAAGVRRREYTPDLVVEMRNGDRVVVEVKASALAELPAWAKVEDQIRRAYRDDHGARFVVLTERDIRRQPGLCNAQIMLAHRGSTAIDIEFALLAALQAQVGLISIQGLSGILDQVGIDYDQTFNAVMQMALAGKVKVEFSREFSASTRVGLVS